MESLKWSGKAISVPGVYADIPFDVYHSQKVCVGSSVSSSNLKRALICNGGSAAHCYATWSGNPDAVEREDAPYLTLGRAVHHLMLGQANFSKFYAIQPAEYADSQTGELKKWNGNATVCKAWRAEIEAQGRSILSGAMVDQIKGMALALGRNALVRQGLLNGLIERSIIWRDKATGLWCKSRPDAIPIASGDFADLKTTESVQINDIVRSISQFGYHQQAALARAGMRELGVEMRSWSLVFIERKPPHCVRVVSLKQEAMDTGEKQNRAALNLIAECIKAKSWPGPDDDHIVGVDLSDNYRTRAEGELQ